MDAKRIPFEQLPITNRFMFAMVFGHKEIAKPFLGAVLGIRIHELKDPEPENRIGGPLLQEFLNFVSNSLRLGNAKHVWRFSRLAEFIIFSKYRDVAEKSIREYLKYFATRNPSSPETKKIDRMVKWYQTDNETRKCFANSASCSFSKERLVLTR